MSDSVTVRCPTCGREAQRERFLFPAVCRGLEPIDGDVRRGFRPTHDGVFMRYAAGEATPAKPPFLP